MKSLTLPEENTWSMATDISLIEEDFWINQENKQESSKNNDWVFPMKTETCPDISTIVPTHIEFEDILERENAPLEAENPHTLEEFPGTNLSTHEFLELLNWEGTKGNLGKK
ncbi:hypothetical protein O181_027470 [Austropuccinia psidii MF-1]|uniref:Uncharacterized protein n=1 Tax=Austropuccinia psidii MF-1 TaxID=1389203 RepID=A0A9Q3CR52_9BASI|nr:hypothetical protein [Austropuccinia psidii MF-1]